MTQKNPKIIHQIGKGKSYPATTPTRTLSHTHTKNKKKKLETIYSEIARESAHAAQIAHYVEKFHLNGRQLSTVMSSRMGLELEVL